MGIMSPVHFTPEKECYTVLVLQFFQAADIQERSVSDTFGTKNADQPLEKLVEIQALSLDLRRQSWRASAGESPAVGPVAN